MAVGQYNAAELDLGIVLVDELVRGVANSILGEEVVQTRRLREDRIGGAVRT